MFASPDHAPLNGRKNCAFIGGLVVGPQASHSLGNKYGALQLPGQTTTTIQIYDGKMLNQREKEVCKTLLETLDDFDLQSLFRTVTQKQIAVENKQGNLPLIANSR